VPDLFLASRNNAYSITKKKGKKGHIVYLLAEFTASIYAGSKPSNFPLPFFVCIDRQYTIFRLEHLHRCSVCHSG
jgi:hypothetical protein